MAQASHLPSLDELTAAARALAPLARDHAIVSEDQHDLPRALMEALWAAGLHRVYMPRRFGGYEMDWGAHFPLGRAVARGCGSAGWLVSLVFSHIMWVARFPAQAQEEFFATAKEPVLGTGSAGGGLLRAVDGGYVLNGRWGFVSGVNHAAGVMVVAKSDPGQLFSHFVLLRPDQYKVENNWDAEGLRGTGSHHINVAEQFVPAYRTVDRDEFLGHEPPGAKLHQSYIYRVRPPLYQKSWFPAVLLGAAEGALEEYCAQTRGRTGQLFGEGVADQVPVQIRVGESQAELDTASLVFESYMRFLHEKGRAGEDIVGGDLLKSRRTITLASRLCVGAADRLAAMMGVTAQSGRNPVQRLFRDCRTVATHIELNWDHSMAPTGKYLLGLKTGDPLVDAPAQPPPAGPATRALLGTQI